MIQYAVLVAVVGGGVMTANWHQIGQAFFRLDMIELTISNGLGRAMLNTIVYALGAFAGGAVLGTVLALMRLSQVAPYRWLATIYIEFFRGLPAIIVLLAFSLIGLVFPGLTIPGGLVGSVSLGLGIVSAAYLAETIRAGILAVPKGQVEAARSLGMPAGMAMRTIVLPQAFRIILPPMTNELILLIKDSSLVFVIGLTREAYELTKYGRDFAATHSNLTPLVFAGFCYLLITLPLTFLVRRLEASSAKAR
ncbi:MAG: amino acid ABC transporter permease [Austwickia sp.]|nr:amino acid ABC transporter permease [Austwickia sp.]MBK8435827.1 amino acid ABC transporter permease [Austwickia sp.]MBK9101513.1 amino acid ABC transporter permease [Austwickia sp.]